MTVVNTYSPIQERSCESLLDRRMIFLFGRYASPPVILTHRVACRSDLYLERSRWSVTAQSTQRQRNLQTTPVWHRSKRRDKLLGIGAINMYSSSSVYHFPDYFGVGFLSNRMHYDGVIAYLTSTSLQPSNIDCQAVRPLPVSNDCQRSTNYSRDQQANILILL